MLSTRSKEASKSKEVERGRQTIKHRKYGCYGSSEYNQIERDIGQMTGFSNMLNRDENEEGQSMRRNYSQDNEIRNMPESRNDPGLTKDLDR